MGPEQSMGHCTFSKFWHALNKMLPSATAENSEWNLSFSYPSIYLLIYLLILIMYPSIINILLLTTKFYIYFCI